MTIIPVINKIELQAADVEGTKKQMMEEFEFDEKEIIYISAKQGKNVDEVFKAIIDKVKPPLIKEENKNLTAFLFDARFIPNRGVACLVKIMSGTFDL